MLCSSVQLRYWWIYYYYLWWVKAVITQSVFLNPVIGRHNKSQRTDMERRHYQLCELWDKGFARGVLIALLPLLCQLRNSRLVRCHKQFIFTSGKENIKIEKLYILKIQTLPQITQNDLNEYNRLCQFCGSWCYFLHVLDLSCLFMMKWSLSFSSAGTAKTWNTNSMPYIDAWLDASPRRPCATVNHSVSPSRCRESSAAAMKLLPCRVFSVHVSLWLSEPS